MAITLRPDQTAVIDDLRAALGRHRRVLLQAPTGFGKTVCISYMMQRAAERGKASFLTVHRSELVDQSARTLDEFGVGYGHIAAGYAPNPYQPIQICSIDTLRSRLKAGRVKFVPDLLIVDEAHHSASATWTWVIDQFPDARIVGLTATPERLDGRGVDRIFETMVQGPSVACLIQAGFLSDYRAFAPATPDMGGVASQGGDYARKQNAARMDEPTITGSAIEHYRKFADGKRAVAFCCSIEHSQHVAQQFRREGIPAWHVDGDTERSERRNAIADFRGNSIQVLCGVDLFSEGFDLPAMEAAILLRPTKSLALHLQQCGRALRTAPGKAEALILDHAGNLARHGLPDDERQWSLLGKKARRKLEGTAQEEKGAPIRQCIYCYAVFHPAPACPECGRTQPVQSRVVKEVKGELVEVDKARLREARKSENRGAKTLEALIALGESRGYKSPKAWAEKMIELRATYRGKNRHAPPERSAQPPR